MEEGIITVPLIFQKLWLVQIVKIMMGDALIAKEQVKNKGIILSALIAIDAVWVFPTGAVSGDGGV